MLLGLQQLNVGRAAEAGIAIDAPPVKDAVNLVIPKAQAKISLRLPPTEDPEHAMKMLEEHVMKNVPNECWNIQTFNR